MLEFEAKTGLRDSFASHWPCHLILVDFFELRYHISLQSVAARTSALLTGLNEMVRVAVLQDTGQTAVLFMKTKCGLKKV